MEKFLSKIKEVLNQANEEFSAEIDVMGYLATLRQNKDQLQEMVKDCGNPYYIEYAEDETGGYTNGEIEIGLPNGEYAITLLYEEKLQDYCTCRPGDKGYNEKHKCCGEHCDWTIPVIQITKKSSTSTTFSFQGTQKDLWKLEETKQDNSKEINELKKSIVENLQYIEMITNNIYKIKEQLNKLEGIA